MKYLLLFIFGLLMANDALALCVSEKLEAERKQKSADEFRTRGGGGISNASSQFQRDQMAERAWGRYEICIKEFDAEEKELVGKRGRNESLRLELEHEEMLLHQNELELKRRELEIRERELELREKKIEQQSGEDKD